MVVGRILRAWRTQRRMTQAQLARDAEVSTRHLSCVETGKARPSREMVLVLCSALDLPLRQRNQILKAAGFAPAYAEHPLDGPALRVVRDQLAMLLERMEPAGAVVVDRGWDVLMANSTIELLGRWLLGPDAPPAGNLLERTFDPDGLRPFIENFDDVAVHTLNALHREFLQTGDERVGALRDRLAAMPGVPSWKHRQADEAVLVPLTLARDGLRLSFFSTIATLGTAADVTLAELRIESYFPADAATAQALSLIAS